MGFLKFSSGIGWGKFVGQHNSFKNPFGKLDDDLYLRPASSSNYERGGTLVYDKWFRGDAVFFGGFEVPFGKKQNISLKIESNPFDYFQFGCCGEGLSQESYQLRNSKKRYNSGLSFKLKEYGNIDISYVKGDTFNLSFSFGINSKKLRANQKKFKPNIINIDHNQTIKNEFYNDLLVNLNNNRLFLQTANLDEKTLSLTIDTPDIINPIQYSSRSALIAEKVLKINSIDINYIDVGLLTRGSEINNIRYTKDDLASEHSPVILTKRNTKILNVDPKSYQNDAFKPKVNFPVFFNSIQPDVRTHIGSPDRFLFSGFGIKLVSEIQINRNLTFYSSVGQSLVDNFDKKTSLPTSILPHVRTEIVDYLQNSDEIYIKQLQLDYITSLDKNLYARLSFGYLEDMYGGLSSELLYKSFFNNFAASIELNQVKKREYDGRFKFRDYDNLTYHLNTAYYIPKNNILLKLSYGEYLAGDIGYTLDLSRRMSSGWQSGFYFSRTNVSPEVFGEGSFDKGFYFKIPFNVFQRRYSKNNIEFALKTMTRDGGQKLIIQNKLIDSFYGTSVNEINENWKSYLK